MSDRYHERARLYRKRARELRDRATTMKAEEQEPSLLQIALDYDRLALIQEQLALDCPGSELNVSG
jgi:hypothetical protein